MSHRFLFILLLFVPSINGCAAPLERTPHELAMERFESMRQSGFKATYGEIAQAVHDCFPVGMEVAKVQKLLAKMGASNLEGGGIRYSMMIDHVDHSWFIEVITGGYPGHPPVIKMAHIGILPSA